MRSHWPASLLARGVLSILLIVLPLLFLWKGLLVVTTATRARQDVEAALAAARTLQDPSEDARVHSTAAGTLDAAARSLAALQGELRPFESVLRLARVLPPDIGWVADVPDALTIAVPLARAGAAVAEPVAGPLRVNSMDGSRPTRSTAAVGNLSQVLPRLTAELETAAPALGRLRDRSLGGPLRPLTPVVEELADLLPVLQVFGAAFGTDTPRTYLLLGQNSDELRASGGFIGTVGSFTVAQGALLRFQYGSSYEVDAHVSAPAPPSPMARHLGLSAWYLRDANWWAHFPATAAQVEAAWRRAGHEPIDGVIGIDDTVVDRLLRLVGPLDVPGFGSVDADSFVRITVEQLYTTSPQAAAGNFHQRTSGFFGAFSRAFTERLQRLSPAELIAVGKALSVLLDEKHIQLAFKQPGILPVAHSQGWAGAIPALTGDSLYVVDTTVSYGKTHMFVEAEGALHVSLEADGRISHTLILDYTNLYPRGLQAWMPAEMVAGDYFDAATGRLVSAPGFWGNWLRVYLPPDAQDIVVAGLEEQPPPAPEFGRLLVAGHLALPPGQRRAIEIRYSTRQRPQPPAQYRLYLHKQAGLACRRMAVQVRWPGGRTANYNGCPALEGWLQFD